MEIQGKVIEIPEAKSGQSARGTWKKQDFIIETDESFPKKICLTNWNDKVDLSSLNVGDEIKASVNIESREYNGNWFTDIKVWKMEKVQSPSAGDQGGLPGLDSGEAPPPPWDSDPGESEPDLPF